MSKSLYNKYRSQTFDELVGQESVTRLLRNAVKKGKVANAYLMVGSRGTGKTSTARILARALNCMELTDEGNPCNKCDYCKAILSSSFMDLIEIDAASNRGIDQIRELKEKIEFSPTQGKYKIYIIDEVHMLTKEAFNALLKTLEEPPKHVVFILATTDVHKLPPTILSRCQRYDFKLGTPEEIEKVVVRSAKSEGVVLDSGALAIIVNNAKGSYRDAMSLLDVVVSGQVGSDDATKVSESEVRSILGLTSDDFIEKFIVTLINGDASGALGMLYQAQTDGININQFTKQALERLRKALVVKITGVGVKGDLENVEMSLLNKVIADFIGVDRNIKYTTFPSLSLELLIAQYANLDSKVSTTAQKKVEDAEAVSKSVEKENTDSKPVLNSVDKVSEEKVVVEEDDTVEEEEPSNPPSENESVQGGSEGAVDISSIKEKWSNILQMVQSSNGPLAAILRNSQVLTVEGSTMSLQVPFQFYKDRVEESKSREIINGAIRDLLGVSMKISCVVNGTVNKKRKVSPDFILSSVSTQQTKKTAPKPKVSKRVEEIFADM